jgi:hypothetical protein
MLAQGEPCSSVSEEQGVGDAHVRIGDHPARSAVKGDSPTDMLRATRSSRNADRGGLVHLRN